MLKWGKLQSLPIKLYWMADKGSVARAMTLGQECYEQWGLVPEEADQIIKKLKSEGALAVKMTGAGDGGFVVALWKE